MTTRGRQAASAEQTGLEGDGAALGPASRLQAHGVLLVTHGESDKTAGIFFWEISFNAFWREQVEVKTGIIIIVSLITIL